MFGLPYLLQGKQNRNQHQTDQSNCSPGYSPGFPVDMVDTMNQILTLVQILIKIFKPDLSVLKNTTQNPGIVPDADLNHLS
jgi:hypothetical protein